MLPDQDRVVASIIYVVVVPCLLDSINIAGASTILTKRFFRLGDLQLLQVYAQDGTRRWTLNHLSQWHDLIIFQDYLVYVLLSCEVLGLLLGLQCPLHERQK